VVRENAQGVGGGFLRAATRLLPVYRLWQIAVKWPLGTG
jgi:hypothetical protein